MAHRAFKIIEKTKSEVTRWAKENAIPLYTIEHVATFESWDERLSVWVFYETDADLGRCNKSGLSKQVQDRYLAVLREFKYPFDEFPHVGFVFDSHENVVRNYEGSYFYRLR